MHKHALWATSQNGSLSFGRMIPPRPSCDGNKMAQAAQTGSCGGVRGRAGYPRHPETDVPHRLDGILQDELIACGASEPWPKLVRAMP